MLCRASSSGLARATGHDTASGIIITASLWILRHSDDTVNDHLRYGWHMLVRAPPRYDVIRCTSLPLYTTFVLMSSAACASNSARSTLQLGDAFHYALCS